MENENARKRIQQTYDTIIGDIDEDGEMPKNENEIE